MQNRPYLVICLIVFIISFILYRPFAYGISSAPETFFKGSTPYGVPYEEWLIKWWQWHISLPKEGHPFLIPNVANCPVGNSGPVSFLTHSLQGESHLTCTVPSGKSILFPIATGECNSAEAHSDSDPIIQKCATEGQKYATFEVTVDGIRLSGLGPDQNYAISRFFNMTIPMDNVFDFKPGTFKAVVAGYFVFLKPIPTGEHNVSIAARVTNPIDPSFNFDYHTSYVLKVL